LESEELTEIAWLAKLKSSVCKRCYFEVYALLDLEPVQGFECRRDMGKFASTSDSTGHVVLNCLELMDVIGWKVEVEGVAVVEL
jgi:hypothetical protein